MGMDSLEEKKSLLDMVEKLPFWAQTILGMLVLIAAAAVVGHIIGRMYAMVRYPDPEKQGVVHPVIKLAFICLLAGCCFWLYTTAMKQNESAEDNDIQGGMADSGGAVAGSMDYGIAIG